MTNSVRNWLLLIYAMVLAMVVVGGITRLTGSGLSMVVWHPLMGAIPPLGDAEWLAAFDKYKQFPQYQLVNSWMTLSDFKSIFFWEYIHRLLGRLIGVVFFVPWLYFLVRKQLSRPLAAKTAGLFVLGGMQGVLGWYMVKSGLVDHPEVSHFRLAAHLSLALLITQGCLWLIFDELPPRSGAPGKNWSLGAAWAFLGLVCVQIVYGAFMAGTRAGFYSSEFPTFNGKWFPAGGLTDAGVIYDLLHNVWMIQFVHRSLGWLVFATGIALGIHLVKRRDGEKIFRSAGIGLHAMVGLQFLLGIGTVMMKVPVAMAVAHQAGGAFLLSVAVYTVHGLQKR